MSNPTYGFFKAPQGYRKREDIGGECLEDILAQAICDTCEFRTGTGNCRQMCNPREIAGEVAQVLMGEDGDEG